MGFKLDKVNLSIKKIDTYKINKGNGIRFLKKFLLINSAKTSIKSLNKKEDACTKISKLRFK